MSRKKAKPTVPASAAADYDAVLAATVGLLEGARHAAARSVNVVMTATYWELGRRIVRFEQRGEERAAYGEGMLTRLAADLSRRFGRGFSLTNLKQFRTFFLTFRHLEKGQTVSDQFDPATFKDLAGRFPLSWSHYVSLLSVERAQAREFYEAEALRGGWAVRQLKRQIGSQFYERTLLSRDKATMLKKGGKAKPEDAVTPEEEIKDPFVLEFLHLKDEYSESSLEEALIRHLESFLLELGNDFAFVGRQKRLRVDDEWFRVDLVFFHRRLKCLVLIDLKLDKLTAGDVGQMNLYVNYARHHWTHPGENPPVGLILCAEQGAGVARYALEGMTNKILASEYRTALPSEAVLTAELIATRKILEGRVRPSGPKGKKKT